MHKQKAEAIERREMYNSSPRTCLECNKILLYQNRHNTFCSHSCSAKHSNTSRIAAGWAPSKEQKLRTSLALKGRPGHHACKGKHYAIRKSVICAECGNSFSIRNADTRKYCSYECRVKNSGGPREKSGYSKSGYYRGVYCGSTYELAWVIYRLDHGLPVIRFEGYIPYGDNKKYFPDFVEGTIIHEMKGWVTTESAATLKQKEIGAQKAGYSVKLYFRADLELEFEWVKQNYNFKSIDELYDDFSPRFMVVCGNCGITFGTHDRNRKRCSRGCCGTPVGTKFKENKEQTMSTGRQSIQPIYQG